MWDIALCCVGLLFDISAKPGPLSPRHSLIQALLIKLGVNVKVKPCPAAPGQGWSRQVKPESMCQPRLVKVSLKALHPPHNHNLSSVANPRASRRSQGESSQVKVVGQEVKSRRACRAILPRQTRGDSGSLTEGGSSYVLLSMLRGLCARSGIRGKLLPPRLT